MIPILFSFFLDYQCNFECAHCSVGSNPRAKMPMKPEVFDSFFAQIRSVPSARILVFTGGETTLRLPQLLRGLTLAREAGLRTRVVSNAWWAKSEDEALTYLRRLKDHGLDEINTSFDDYHVPFVDFSHVVHLVKAARALQMPAGVGVITGANARYDGAWVRAELARELGVTVEALPSVVSVLEDLPTPSGTGKDLDVTSLDPGGKIDLGCPEVVKTVSIHPDGTVKACCGQSMFDTHDLNLGNLIEEPLAVILARAQKNIVYWWIHTRGPQRILEVLGIHERHSSICHACQSLLTKHRDALLSYLSAHASEVLVDDILMSDHIKRVAQVVQQRKKDIFAVVGAPCGQ